MAANKESEELIYDRAKHHFMGKFPNSCVFSSCEFGVSPGLCFCVCQFLLLGSARAEPRGSVVRDRLCGLVKPFFHLG